MAGNQDRLLTTARLSYPRLTLDFHTNKRLIDEVVRPMAACLYYLRLLMPSFISAGRRALKTPA